MLKAANIAKPNHSSSLQPWIVCLVSALFFFYEFVQMNMFNAVNSHLMFSFGVDAAKLGSLSSAYFIANILLMFPAGILLDRFSTRKLIVTAMLICIAGTLAFSFVSSLGAAIVCRFLTGIGGSFPFLCCLRLASRWFQPKRMALITGLIVTMAMLGGMAAQTPLTFLVEYTSWREALRYDALLGLIFLALILWHVQDFPKTSITPQEPRLTTFNFKTILRTTTAIIKNRSNWLISLYVSFLNLPLMLLGGLWGSLYLSQSRGFTPIEASYATSMIFFGTILGSPIVGWFSDHIENRRKPMLIGAAITIALTLWLMATPTLPISLAIILFFALGFTSSTQILGYPAITESNSLATAGSALGFASVIIMSGPAVFEPMFGHILDQHWMGAMLNGARLYSSHAFLDALAIFPIAGILAYTAILLTRKNPLANQFYNLADESIRKE